MIVTLPGHLYDVSFTPPTVFTVDRSKAVSTALWLPAAGHFVFALSIVLLLCLLNPG